MSAGGLGGVGGPGGVGGAGGTPPGKDGSGLKPGEDHEASSVKEGRRSMSEASGGSGTVREGERMAAAGPGETGEVGTHTSSGSGAASGGVTQEGIENAVTQGAALRFGDLPENGVGDAYLLNDRVPPKDPRSDYGKEWMTQRTAELMKDGMKMPAAMKQAMTEAKAGPQAEAVEGWNNTLAETLHFGISSAVNGASAGAQNMGEVIDRLSDSAMLLLRGGPSSGNGERYQGGQTFGKAGRRDWREMDQQRSTIVDEGVEPELAGMRDQQVNKENCDRLVDLLVNYHMNRLGRELDG